MINFLVKCISKAPTLFFGVVAIWWLCSTISDYPYVGTYMIVSFIILFLAVVSSIQTSTKVACFGFWLMACMIFFLIANYVGVSTADRTHVFDWGAFLTVVGVLSAMSAVLYFLVKQDSDELYKKYEKKDPVVSAPRTPEQIKKDKEDRIATKVSRLVTVPDRYLDAEVARVAAVLGMSAFALKKMVLDKRESMPSLSAAERRYWLDYYAGDADSYDYMQSKGIDPHNNNLHLSDEQKLDMMDEMYYGDEDLEDSSDEYDDLDNDVDDDHYERDNGALFHDHDNRTCNNGLFGDSHEEERSFWNDHYRYDHDEYCDHEDHEHDW